MLYLIEHDKQTDAPKTRWGQFNGNIEEVISTLTTFCAALSDISGIYVHDHNGKCTPLETVCDFYNIPYKKGV